MIQTVFSILRMKFSITHIPSALVRSSNKSDEESVKNIHNVNMQEARELGNVMYSIGVEYI